MKPDTFYFPHDYNAQNDPKMITLLHRCGLEGIGAYWVIVELMHQQPDDKLPYEVFESQIRMYCKLHNKTDTQVKDICSALIETKLFKKDGEYITCARVSNNKKHREAISEKRREAGRISAEKRFGKPKPEHPKPDKSEKEISQDTFTHLKDEKFSNTFKDYIEMRVKIRKPATDRAKEMVLEKLHKHDINTAIAMLEQSIVSSWQNIYELKKPDIASSAPSNNWDVIISQKLGNIATKDMIKEIMMVMPKTLWWKIEEFLKERYSGYDRKGFTEAEREASNLFNHA